MDLFFFWTKESARELANSILFFKRSGKRVRWEGESILDNAQEIKFYLKKDLVFMRKRELLTLLTKSIWIVDYESLLEVFMEV